MANKGKGNMSYTSIAKDQPSGGSMKGGVDNWKVVAGQPGGGSDAKGSTKNMGKMKGSY